MTVFLGNVPHRLYVMIRRHPTTIFWLISCAVFAAGIAGRLLLLAALLVAQLGMAIYLVRRPYAKKAGAHERSRRE